MKTIQAVVLVLAGALGALLFVKMKGGSDTPAPTPVAEAPQTVTSPAVVPQTGATPARTEKKPARTAPAPAHRGSEPPMIASNSQPVPEAPQPPTPAAPPPPAPAVMEPASRPVEAPAPPPPAPARKVTLTAGTLLSVRLIDSLSSDKNHAGDTFSATLDEPVVVDGLVIAERGARVEGRVLDAQQAGRVKGLATIGLQLTTLVTSDGQRVEILTDNFTKSGPEGKKTDAAKIGGAAAIGAAIGAIAGGGKGAAIGAGVGGAAGTGGVLATRGNPAVLASETKLTFRLSDAVTITEKRKRG